MPRNYHSLFESRPKNTSGRTEYREGYKRKTIKDVILAIVLMAFAIAILFGTGFGAVYFLNYFFE
ncbi:MAG: hypothetical protein QM489_05240 [Candidatus Izemoplasma sp.]